MNPLIEINNRFNKAIDDNIKNIDEALHSVRKAREEMMDDDRHTKLTANLKDMTIEQKIDVLVHSRKMKTKTLSDCLDAIIEEHPYVYYEYFGE